MEGEEAMTNATVPCYECGTAVTLAGAYLQVDLADLPSTWKIACQRCPVPEPTSLCFFPVAEWCMQHDGYTVFAHLSGRDWFARTMGLHDAVATIEAAWPETIGKLA